MESGIFNGYCIVIGVCVVVTLHCRACCGDSFTIFLDGTAADRQERCSPANFLANGLDEDQLLHVKCPVSGCRVMATLGPRLLVMETSRRRAAAKGSWPFGDEVDAVVLMSF